MEEALVLLVFCPIYLKSRSGYKNEDSFLELLKRRLYIYIYDCRCLQFLMKLELHMVVRTYHGCLGPLKEQYA